MIVLWNGNAKRLYESWAKSVGQDLTKPFEVVQDKGWWTVKPQQGWKGLKLDFIHLGKVDFDVVREEWKIEDFL